MMLLMSLVQFSVVDEKLFLVYIWAHSFESINVLASFFSCVEYYFLNKDYYSDDADWVFFILLDDDYDSYDSSSSRRTNQLDDKDWQIGNKSIAEEAIDKVKEFVSNIKIFDAPETY